MGLICECTVRWRNGESERERRKGILKSRRRKKGKKRKGKEESESGGESEVRRGTNEVSHLDNSPVKFIETQVNPPTPLLSPFPLPIPSTLPHLPSLSSFPLSVPILSNPPLSFTLTSSSLVFFTLRVSIRSLVSSTRPLLPSSPCPSFARESPLLLTFPPLSYFSYYDHHFFCTLSFLATFSPTIHFHHHSKGPRNNHVVHKYGLYLIFLYISITKLRNNFHSSCSPLLTIFLPS